MAGENPETIKLIKLEQELRRKRIIPVILSSFELEACLSKAERCFSEIIFRSDVIVDKEEKTRFYKARRHVINAMKEIGLYWY